jgi:hypothetical protein
MYMSAEERRSRGSFGDASACGQRANQYAACNKLVAGLLQACCGRLQKSPLLEPREREREKERERERERGRGEGGGGERERARE